jgi:hypothetical protein
MALNAAAKDIKIPTNHYVGFQARTGDDVPLGFMTPDGTDAAATKRKATVDNWAGGGYYGGATKPPKIASTTYENKPLSGFKLGREIRRYASWGQGNVKWRIEDPRGFELEISSPNFASIILCTTLEQGEILEECVWARQGSENVLLPVSSEEYKQAQINTTRVAQAVGLKDLKPGHHVILHSGEEGIYLGAFFTFTDAWGQKGPGVWGDKKRYFVGTYKDGALESVRCTGSIKVSEVRESEQSGLTLEDARDLLNTFAVAPRASRWSRAISEPGHDYRTVKAVRIEKPSDADTTFTLDQKKSDDVRVSVNVRTKVHSPTHSVIEADEYPNKLLARMNGAPNGHLWFVFNPSAALKAIEEYKMSMANYAASRLPGWTGGWRPHVEPRRPSMYIEALDDAALAAGNIIQAAEVADRWGHKSRPSVTIDPHLLFEASVDFFEVTISLDIDGTAAKIQAGV